MTRASWSTVGTGLLLSVVFANCAQLQTRAHAQAATGALPRSLQGGAPAQRFPRGAGVKAQVQTKPRATPAPAIEIDPRELARRGSGERRSLALLQREISLLERLVSHMQRSERDDPRGADVLLRLSYAYQELMWIQKHRLYVLQQQAHDAECRCNASSPAEPPTAVACVTSAARSTSLALR